MAMRSEMSGNVLMNPVLKTVKVKGEDRQICELRVMCSEYKSDGNGGYVQDDTRTFPVQVTIWHDDVRTSMAYTELDFLDVVRELEKLRPGGG